MDAAEDDTFSSFDFDEADLLMIDEMERSMDVTDSPSSSSSSSNDPIQAVQQDQIDDAQLERVQPDTVKVSALPIDNLAVMGPPITTRVLKRRAQPPSVFNDERSKISRPISDEPSTSLKLQTAFFDNWNSDELSSFEQRVKDVKRRFPGPAGCLPPLTRHEVGHLDHSEHPVTQTISRIISSSTVDMRQDLSSSPLFITSPEREILKIDKQPWRILVKSLNLNPKERDSVLNLMNIKWVNTCLWKYPIGTKIPFLAMVIKKSQDEFILNMMKSERLDTNYCLDAMDSTGSIKIAIDYNLKESYGKELRLSTAIAVKDADIPITNIKVSVMRAKGQNVIIVTQENLVLMVSKEDETGITGLDNKNQHLSNSTATQIPGIKVKKFCEYEEDEIRRAWSGIVGKPYIVPQSTSL